MEETNLLGEIQFGFRKDKRTADAIFILTQLIEESRKHGKKIALAFLDIRKAYDRVNRDTLWKVLAEYGITGKAQKLLRSMYANCSATATLGDLESEEIKLEMGLKQGCVLSPILFALYIKELGDTLVASRYGAKIGDLKIPALFFADDMVLIGSGDEDLQSLLDLTSNFIKKR